MNQDKNSKKNIGSGTPKLTMEQKMAIVQRLERMSPEQKEKELKKRGLR